MDGIEGFDPHWAWFVIGLVLAVLEMLIPGVFLIWMAGAALVTGVIAWLVPIGLPIQVVIFAMLAIVAVYAGKRWLASNPVVAADPKMNDRGARIVGDTVVVTAVIEAGNGRVRHGDSEWLAKGPDAEPGTRMRVAGHEGTVLLVEHLH